MKIGWKYNSFKSLFLFKHLNLENIDVLCSLSFIPLQSVLKGFLKSQTI